MVGFFVSYNREDRSWAEWISWQLENAGYSTFVQAWDIRPGANFVLAMQSGLAKAERTLAVLSPAYLNAKFTQPEWAAAFASDPTGERRLLVPVKVAEVDLTGIWTAIVYIDLVGLDEEAARSALLSGIDRDRPKPAQPPAFPGERGTQKFSPAPPAEQFTHAPKQAEVPYPVSDSEPRDTLSDWSVLDIRTNRDGTFAFAFRLEHTRMTDLRHVNIPRPLQPLFTRELSENGTILQNGGTAAIVSELVPETMRLSLERSSRLCVTVDALAARYPWEMLGENAEQSPVPLAVRSGMIRQLRLEADRERPRATKATALIIGDPHLDDPRFAQLAGARAEASMVERHLKDFETTTLIGEDALPPTILMMLHRRPWKILHISAHGVFDFRDREGAEPVSGLVLGDGVFLQAYDIDQLRAAPEVVFVNVGHLGYLGDYGMRYLRLADLAVHLAAQLLAMGASIVVVSGGLIDSEQASNTFVMSFYEALLTGQSFAVAVETARKRSYEHDPLSKTWAAFHCYGSPHYSFAKPVPPHRYLR